MEAGIWIETEERETGKTKKPPRSISRDRDAIRFAV